jgi:hypothetical protein
MEPREMNIFQLVELARSGQKAAALKELTLRFRAAAKQASEESHALGLEVHDGRPGARTTSRSGSDIQLTASS